MDAEAIAECVKELSRRVLMERVREALPIDAPLPSVSIDVVVDAKGNKSPFTHVEGKNIEAEATTFCTQILAPRSKADSKITHDAIRQCAGRVVAAARGRVIEDTVDSEIIEQR